MAVDPVERCPICMREPYLIPLACRRWNTNPAMRRSAVLLLASGLTKRTSIAIEAALALRIYVGSANVRFAIAVYHASDENWDHHARLSRTSWWKANLPVVILLRLVVGVELRTSPKLVFRRRYACPLRELSLICGNASPQHTACDRSIPLPSAPQPPFLLPHALQHSAHAK
jgi:hypothetical protein